ncbi:MAG: hypothetical protein EHM70_22910 [Chloroflexota bacterium]|nr:MAG: hypothetical protein EHM70_22910 [Chloroflexota bacterium]
MNSNRNIVIFLLFLTLALSLGACSVLPSDPGQPQDSDPVFVLPPVVASTPTGIPNDTPAPAGETQPAPVDVPAASGELYFVLNDLHSGALSLGRLPQDCLLSGSACAQVEIVPGFPNLDESVRPLVWSPDGRLAALPYHDLLLIYDPQTGTWSNIAQLMVNDLPEWSPDSAWLAFISQSGDQKDVYLIRPDGSGLKNLTSGQFSGAEHHLAQVFWPGEGQVAFWHFAPQQAKQLVAMRVDNGEWTTLVTMAELTKDTLVYSPNRLEVALESISSGDSQLVIASADGSNMRTIASYGQATLWPLVWSPDGQWVAYSVYRSTEADPFSRVYIAPRDGSAEPLEIFKADNVSALAWGPDSLHLVILGDAAGITQLYLADIQQGTAVLLQAPGLDPQANIQGVSWRLVR